MLLQRNFRQLDAAQTLLYFSVEGAKREKLYFDWIEGIVEEVNNRRLTLIVDAPDAGNSAPNHVLQRALAFHALHSYADPNRMWLVMDMDSQHLPKIKEMLPTVEDFGFRLALSNPCFELWLWLHNREVDPQLTSCESLKNQLGFDIGKWKREARRAWIEAAMGRAAALPGSGIAPFPDFPGTQVGELFRALGFTATA